MEKRLSRSAREKRAVAPWRQLHIVNGDRLLNSDGGDPLVRSEQRLQLSTTKTFGQHHQRDDQHFDYKQAATRAWEARPAQSSTVTDTSQLPKVCCRVLSSLCIQCIPGQHGACAVSAVPIMSKLPSRVHLYNMTHSLCTLDPS